MKTKKILSLLLAIIMVISIPATLSISASAGKLATWVKVEKYGKTFWYRTDKVSYSDNEHEESWECECWDLIVGKLSYSKPDEYTDGYWYDEYPCEHLVEYEPLTTLVMKSNPTKTTYTIGDKIDLTGAKITATTISETTEDVNITSSMVSGFDSTTAGTKTVTVTYRNCTTAFTVTVTPKNTCTLDLDSSTIDIPDHKDLDQNYNLKVNDSISKDNEVVTKVKLSWEIKDINATRVDNKVWNTTELCWETKASTTTINQVGSAKFTLENYSSVKVNATASFKAEGNFKGTASYDAVNGKVTLDTANGNSAYSKTNVPKAVINATISTAADDFKTLSATTKATKYGTYTVTIAKYELTHKIHFDLGSSVRYETLTGLDADFNVYVPDGATVTITEEGNNMSFVFTKGTDVKTVSMIMPHNSITGIANGQTISADTSVTILKFD